MAIRDVVVLNTTASRLETQQSTDTVRIKGSSSEILSVENSSGTSVLSINTSTPSVTIIGDITASGAFSGSLASTASFGRVDSTKLAGSAAGLTNTDKDGTITGSAQIAADVSGSFSSGFNVTGNISGSSVSSGSFSIVSGSTISGDGSGLSSSIPTNVVSGAAQLADNISGSFTNGFEFTGDISGSVNSTGSFGNLFVGGFLIGDGSRLINVTPDSSFSGSVQLESDISGSFIKGFTYDGEISGSVDSTGSFTTLTAEKLVGDGSQLTNKIPVNTVTSSAQLASQISGAFDSGFNYTGIISGSSTATASFGRIDVTNLSATSVDLTNCRPVGLVSSSAQLASQISGAFDSGFEFTGEISGSSISTGSFNHLIATKLIGDASGLSNIIPANTISSSAQIASDVSGSFTSGFEFTGTIKQGNGVWSAGAALGQSIAYHGAAGDKTGQVVAMGLENVSAPYGTQDTERAFEYDGSSWSEITDNNTNRARAAGAGTVNSAVFFGGYIGNWYGTSTGATETYNGTNWSEVSDLIIPRRTHMGAGLTGNAALALGGYQDSAPVNPAFFPNMSKCTEIWDGNIWSQAGASPNNMKRGGMAGSVNAAVAFGSNAGPAATTIHFDGSTWSSGGTGHSPIGIDNGHGGTQNDAISFNSGYIAPYVYTGRTQYYDGTVWSDGPTVINNLAHRGMGHNQGNADGAMAAGGEAGAAAGFAGRTCVDIHSRPPSSASIAHLITSTIEGDGSNLTNCLHPATYISSSTQIAADISGSFTSGFEFTNTVGSVSSVWSTSGFLIHGCNFGAGWGTQNAAAFATNGITEEYNGTVWSANAYAMSSSRECHTGIGTQTAGLVFGGILTPGGSMSDKTETYDGSVWAQVNTMQEARKAHSGAGTQNAGLAFGGVRVPGLVACSEEWNGTNWSEGNDLITARCVLAGSGTQNAGLAIGGKSPSYETDTEEYNGTSYAAGGHLPTGTACLAAAGTQNYSIAFGGNQNPTIVATTVEYDGTAWTSRSSLGTAVEKHNAAGDGSNGLSFSGGPVTRGTEEFTGGAITSASFGKLFATTLQAGDITGITGLNEGSGILSSSAQIASDVSGSFIGGFEFSGQFGRTSDVWSTGGALAVSVGYHSQWGTQNASLVAGAASGSISPYAYNGTQIYNGTTWNNTGHTLINVRSSTAGTGDDSESGIVIAGYINSNKTEEYNGTNWSEVANVPTTNRYNGMAFGATDAAIFVGGQTGNICNTGWNGSSWSTLNNLIRSAHNTAEGGSCTAGIIFGGGDGAYAVNNCTDEWNGTNWYSAGAMINNSYTAAGNGTQNAAWSRHCHPNSQNTGATTEFYNGTSWSTGPLGLVDSYSSQGSGTRSAGLLAGGNKHPYTPANYHTCTEELAGQSIATGSIANIVANTLIGDASLMTNTVPVGGILSGSSPQLRADVTGSFIKGFEFTGTYGNSIGAWSTAASMIDSRYNHTGAGVQDATVAIAGYCDGGAPYTFAKVEHYNGDIWSAGGDLPYVRSGHGAAGSQTATVAWGGFIYGNPVRCKTTNEYNGTSWASANDFPIIIANERGAGIGTQTAAMSVGGNPHSSAQGSGSFMYDGLNWSRQTELGNSYLSATVSVGSVNAAITYGGSPSTNQTSTCNWDGSTWSNTGANMINTAVDHSGGGTQNAAYSAYSPAVPGRTVTEFWNGSAWSQGPDMVYTKMDFSKGNGTTQAGIMFGAQHAPNYNLHCTELWNQTFTTGSSTYNANYKGVSGSLKHVEANKLIVCRENKLKASKSFQLPFFTSDPITGSMVTGAQASDIITGSALTSGSDMSQYFGEVWWNKTENKLKFSFPVNNWSVGTALIQGRNLIGLVGNEFEAMAAGGAIPAVTCTEIWSGMAWTEVADLIDANASYGIAGNSCAAIYQQTYPFGTTKNQCWNGNSWSEVADGGYSASNKQGDGTANAAIFSGGHTPSNTNKVSEWNGTAFYDGPNMPTAKTDHAQAGVQNAAYVFGGNAPASPSTETVKYDGSSWATDVNLPQGIRTHAGSGTSNAALSAAGSEPATTANTNEYNGVAWNAANTLSSARKYASMDGTQAGSIMAGGSPSGALTELYTVTYIKTGCE